MEIQLHNGALRYSDNEIIVWNHTCRFEYPFTRTNAGAIEVDVFDGQEEEVRVSYLDIPRNATEEQIAAYRWRALHGI